MAAVVVTVATAAGLLWRADRGRFLAVARRADQRGVVAPATDPRLIPDPGPEHGPSRPGSGTVTLLQFSSPTCGPCRQVRAVCEAVAGEGIARHLEVDVASEPERAREFDVWRVPTLFVVDAAGQPRWRAAGVPSRAAVEAAIAQVRTDRAVA